MLCFEITLASVQNREWTVKRGPRETSLGMDTGSRCGRRMVARRVDRWSGVRKRKTTVFWHEPLGGYHCPPWRRESKGQREGAWEGAKISTSHLLD